MKLEVKEMNTINDKLNKFMVFIGLFILDIIYSSIVLNALHKFGFNYEKLSNLNQSILLIFIDITFMLIIYLIYRKELNKEFIKYIKNFKKLFSFGLKFWLLGLSIMFISNIIISIFCGETATNEAQIQEALLKMPIYITFASSIFAPFTEEIIFRKCLKKMFKSDIFFIITSGLLFGLVHNLTSLGTIQMLYIIPYGAFGAVFAYMYTKSKSIFIPMTFHFIHNTILIIISLLTAGVI